MALKLPDRTRETTTTTGTGAITLGGAVDAMHRAFSSGLANGDKTAFVIAARDGSGWEQSFGTYTSSTNSLSRDMVLLSSNSGNLVNFGAGTKDVMAVWPGAWFLLPGVDSLEQPHVDDLGKAAFMNPEQIPPSLHPVEKTGAFMLTPADHGRAVFAAHASGFTITLPAAADCADGWCVPVKASGAGNITVAATGSDTVDGGASITITASTTRWIVRYSATAFRSL